jgi:flagellar hook protein FlgE
MASTTALYTGLSGMLANARRLDVIGNNIANANTTAFKSNRMMFATQFSRTYNPGSVPSDNDGGSNPTQVGLGVTIAGTQRDFNSGSVSPTGDPRDLAIDGKGFFVVNRNGQQLYTRAGSFRQDSGNNLVTIDGNRVQGFGVDAGYNIVPGALVDLNIPIGVMKIADATRNVDFTGNLNANGNVATRGSLINIGGAANTGLSLIPGTTVPAPSGDALAAGSLLTEIADPNIPTAPLFAAGQTFEIRGAERGDGTLPSAQYSITAASTVQDLMSFLAAALGINTTTGANPDGRTPGVELDTSTGALIVSGNTGTVNDLDLDSSDLRLLDSEGQFVRSPLVAQDIAEADGESVRTTFIAYDSLGTPVPVQLAMTLESRGNSGTAWRYFVDSAEDSDAAPAVATGTITFDTQGQLQSTAGIPIRVDRSGTGAGSPLDLTLNFTSGAGTLTALASDGSGLAAVSQDGSPLGTLSSFGVAQDGTVVGSFTNGLTRTLGQVALATFSNQEGLIDEGNNLFRLSASSGTAVITTPGEIGTGQVVGGALELSNVDLGQEFINMILTSTGYSASSRIIRTTDELLQQLLVIGR